MEDGAMERHTVERAPGRPLAASAGAARPGARRRRRHGSVRLRRTGARHRSRRRGWSAPGFRSPPRLVGVDRSIRRSRGQAAVAVRRPATGSMGGGRPDMIEGGSPPSTGSATLVRPPARRAQRPALGFAAGASARRRPADAPEASDRQHTTTTSADRRRWRPPPATSGRSGTRRRRCRWTTSALLRGRARST